MDVTPMEAVLQSDETEEQQEEQQESLVTVCFLWCNILSLCDRIIVVPVVFGIVVVAILAAAAASNSIER
jgi:hypothetical protein